MGQEMCEVAHRMELSRETTQAQEEQYYANLSHRQVLIYDFYD